MRSRQVFLRLVVFLYVALPVVAQEAEEAAPVRIAVADLTRLFEGYRKRAEYQEGLGATAKSLRERERLLAARVEQVERDASGYAMGHPRRLELIEELRQRREELQQFRVEAERQLDEMVRAGAATLYADITGAIEQVARERGIDLVVKRQSFDVKQPSAEAQADAIGRQPVLYCAPRLDITEEVLRRLNAPQDDGGAAPPEPGR